VGLWIEEREVLLRAALPLEIDRQEVGRSNVLQRCGIARLRRAADVQLERNRLAGVEWATRPGESV